MPPFDLAMIFNDFLIKAWQWSASGDVLEWLKTGSDWFTEHVRESPALVIGLTAFLIFPAIAVAGSLLRLASPKLVKRPTLPAEDPGISSPNANQVGFLEFTHFEAAPYAIRHGIVRIGREGDNDVCLDHQTVHRYHAVIERTPDAEFLITYMGDPESNGLRINGRRVQCERLLGGEILDIGAIKLRFTLSDA